MMKKRRLEAQIFFTEYGCLEIKARDDHLHQISLDGDPLRKTQESPLLDSLKHDLRKYFNGEKVDFSSYAIDLSGFTPFQKKVLMAVRNIPWGETSSYGDIARRINHPMAYRSVGNALAKNRLPIIIPCHRVLRSDGSLGGFSAGIRWKKILLRLERTSESWIEAFQSETP